MSRSLFAVLLLLVLPTVVAAHEPPSVAIQDLFEEADLVAFVSIRAGDLEAYDAAVYKATVDLALKGTSRDATIHFGPYVYRWLGGDYLVFLRADGSSVADHQRASGASGRPGPFEPGATYYSEMYEGYSVMRQGYSMEYHAPELKGEYCLLVSPLYIKLPDKMKTVPYTRYEGAGGGEWVSRSDLLKLLEKLAK